MTLEKRLELIERNKDEMSIVRLCELIKVCRSNVYYEKRGISKEDVYMMKVHFMVIERSMLA